MRRGAARELVLTVALPEDRGRRGDARSKVHRFRSHWVELGRRLRAFRVRYGLTQAEVARAVGAGGHSTVAVWERGVNVPEGLRRERLVELLEGRRWPELRAAALVGIAGDGLPEAWGRGARWYRRASRGRVPRETAGAVVAAMLEDLRAAVSPAALRQRYGERGGGWAQGVAAEQGLGQGHRADVRRLEDAAHGLRWLELAHGLRFDLRRSLVPRLPLRRLGARGAGGEAPGGPEGQRRPRDRPE